MSARAAAPTEHVNEVHLVGRLAAAPAQRELPSGDVVVIFRVVVARPPVRASARRSAAGTRTPTVDTLDCAAWRADVRRSLLAAAAGDVLDLHGSLRRRFWRAGPSAVSRSEVEVIRVRRFRAAP